MTRGLGVVLAGTLALAALGAALDWRLAPLGAAMGAVTLSPLARKRRLWFVGDIESEYALALRRREEAMRALKDLDEDHEAGRIPVAEHARQRPALLQQARELTTLLEKSQQRRNEVRARLERELGEEKP